MLINIRMRFHDYITSYLRKKCSAVPERAQIVARFLKFVSSLSRVGYTCSSVLHEGIVSSGREVFVPACQFFETRLARLSCERLRSARPDNMF